MYVPAHVEESDRDRLHALIARNPLGILVTHGASGLDANHLPFELQVGDGALGILHTHVARMPSEGHRVRPEVLVVFRRRSLVFAYPSVDDIDGLRTDWISLGAPTLTPPETRPGAWRVRAAHARPSSHDVWQSGAPGPRRKEAS